MSRSKIAIFLFSLIPIYMMPVLSMHICIGQGNHHGSCNGEMHKDKGGKDKRKHFLYIFEQAEHLHCLQLQKETNPCIHCKVDVPVQQLAMFATTFDFHPDEQGNGYHAEYRVPPNKEPPAAFYRIRPPPCYLL